jgi:segregation and condensation protein B
MTPERDESPLTGTPDGGGGSDETRLDLAEVAARLAERERRQTAAAADDGSAEESGEALTEDAAADGGVVTEESDEVRSALAGADEAASAAGVAGGTGEDGEQPELVEAERPLSGAEAYAAVEALLFAADHPVTAAQIARALPRGLNAKEVRRLLKALGEELASGERGFALCEIGGGWQLLTREKFAPYVMRLRKATAQRRLSGSALETLAVVAYRQPVTRAEIERIRGVNCGEMLRGLMEKRLVRMTGRSEELGSPLLYGTTGEFLEHFGLASVSDLPRTGELGRRQAKEDGAAAAPAADPAQPAAGAAPEEGAAAPGLAPGAEPADGGEAAPRPDGPAERNDEASDRASGEGAGPGDDGSGES